MRVAAHSGVAVFMIVVAVVMIVAVRVRMCMRAARHTCGETRSLLVCHKILLLNRLRRTHRRANRSGPGVERVGPDHTAPSDMARPSTLYGQILPKFGEIGPAIASGERDARILPPASG
jgi:hypothetical protein